jgi:hypothetical protein
MTTHDDREESRMESSRRSTGTRRTGLLLALIAALAATTASAVVLKGRGELHAAGSGLAVLDMRGVVHARGGGILIVEPQAIVDIDGQGRETQLDDGRILYEGYGRAKIVTPRRSRIEIAGARIRLHARGAGRAVLRGCGLVHTDDVDGDWEEDVEVEFQSDSGNE